MNYIECLKKTDINNVVEVACKFGYPMGKNETEEELIINVSNHVLNNISKVTMLYTNKILEYLKQIINAKDKTLLEEPEYNAIICDEIVSTMNNEGETKFIVPDDICEHLKKYMDGETYINDAKRYNELEEIISGIIEQFGIINSDKICEICLKLINDITSEEVEHFLFQRDYIQAEYGLYSNEGEDYFYLFSIDDPEELLEEINQEGNYNVLTKNEYISLSENKCSSDEKEFILKLKDLIKEYIDDEYKREDLLSTIIYDCKTQNKQDLMIDIATYITLETKDAEDKFKNIIENLYEKVYSWTLLGHRNV